MSARPQPGDRPQPVYATREAIDQGAALLRGRCLETAVEEAVRTGRVLYNGSPRGVVFDPAAVPGWVARFKIVPARHRQGTALLVQSVEPYDHRRERECQPSTNN